MTRHSPLLFAVGIAVPFVALQLQPLPVVATDLQLPGTQPNEVATLNTPSQCDNCHGGYDAANEPATTWRGSPMAHSARDPVFWATMAISEQDFPGSGDFCLRCHTPRGWLEGRVAQDSTGAALASGDESGVECALCHKQVDPDDSEHLGTQNAPYIANDGGAPAEAYLGSGMFVLQDGGTRLGPYVNVPSTHSSLQSLFHRSSDMCGTCHDVSNPVVGDLAHNNGAMVPLAPGTFSGVPGAAVTQKAAFNNFPFQYGVVERTFSEHQSSTFKNLRVQDYGTLPLELQRGVLAKAREQALLANTGGDHADGTTRYFTCQTCHMMPVVAKGAKQNAAPVRTDMARHDLVGGSSWLPELIQWADQNGRLTFGDGLSNAENQALDDGAERARALLKLSAALDVEGDELRVVNLTGHKLFTGYPEGRRMWLQVRWYDRLGNVVREDGGYGTMQATANGAQYNVEALLDPDDPNLHVYEAKLGLTQQWANQLLGFGLPASLPIGYDRVTGAVTKTLGQLAAQPAGTHEESFHFVLNNLVVKDTRIPPYGFDHDEALARSARPVPETLFGDPGPGGIYDYFDTITIAPPAGALRAEFELLYQSTTWEYVQFLLMANDGADPFLGAAGLDVFDGWLATGMSPPEEVAEATWCSLPGTGDDLALESGAVGAPLDGNCSKEVHGGEVARFRMSSPNHTLDNQLGAIAFELYSDSGPMPLGLLPGVQLDHADHIEPFLVAPSGNTFDIVIPAGMDGSVLRAQALVLSPLTLGGFLGTSEAHDVVLED